MVERADAVLAPGLRLDRYELLCPLARGGMAEVWAARQLGKHGFQRVVAIKTILSAHASDERARRMFLEEGRLAASIRHPNVASIYDFGEERDLLFLVLEYIEGDSLAQLERAARAADAKLPLGVALRIMADTAQALHAAHELRGPDGRLTTVVQRDVSPQNVLLSTAGAVKVIDFGIAKLLDQVRQDTSAGLIKGKLQYMAPEQALGRQVDRRADIWGAGATLYHLLAGHPAIRGKNELETLHLLTSGQPPPPLQDTPRQVREIVEKCLAYEPEDRFETAEALHLALERAIHELCGVVTAADIAKVVAERLGDRIATRQSVVRKACFAADDRARLAAEFDHAATVANESSRRPQAPTPESSVTTAILPRRRDAAVAPSRGARFRVNAAGIGVSLGAVLFIVVMVLIRMSRAGETEGVAGVEPLHEVPAPIAVTAAAPPSPAVSPSEQSPPPPLSQAPAEPAALTSTVPPAQPRTSTPRAHKPDPSESPLNVVRTRK